MIMAEGRLAMVCNAAYIAGTQYVSWCMPEGDGCAGGEGVEANAGAK